MLFWDPSSGRSQRWRAPGVEGQRVRVKQTNKQTQCLIQFSLKVNSEVRKEAQAVVTAAVLQKVQLSHMTSLSSVPSCLNTPFHLQPVFFLPHLVSFACWLSCLILKYFISCRFISPSPTLWSSTPAPNHCYTLIILSSPGVADPLPGCLCSSSSVLCFPLVSFYSFCLLPIWMCLFCCAAFDCLVSQQTFCFWTRVLCLPVFHLY